MNHTTTAGNQIEDEYAWVFFGRNSEYYLRLWQLRQQGKYIHFSFIAFFLGLFWFAYRRMYRMIFLFMLVVFTEGMVEQALVGEARGQAGDILASLIYASLFGVFGNAVYLWDAERKMRKVLRRDLPRAETLAGLRRAGGTSFRVLLLLLALVGLLLGLYKWLGQAH